eukprot:1446381-Rhodomonas_salina.1
MAAGVGRQSLLFQSSLPANSEQTLSSSTRPHIVSATFSALKPPSIKRAVLLCTVQGFVLGTVSGDMKNFAIVA